MVCGSVQGEGAGRSLSVCPLGLSTPGDLAGAT